MIIVTGGAGFIGSNMVQTLQEKYKDEKIVVVDFFNDTEKWRNLNKKILWDLVHPDALFDYLESHTDIIKGVFHLGAISSTMETNVDLIIETNFRLTVDLWTWCTYNEVPFLYASSAATYGDGSNGFDDDTSLKNLQKFCPLNAYGWSKHLTDLRLVKMADSGFHPPKWAGFKFFNVYGPNEYHKEGQKSVIATFLPIAKEKGVITLFESNHPDYQDGEQKRDFVWVGDCCDVMLWFYEHEAPNGLYNIGCEKAETFNTLARLIFDSIGQAPVINYRPIPENIADKYQNFTQADLTKLRQAGFTQKMTPLSEGVRHYIQNYLLTSDPYR